MSLFVALDPAEYCPRCRMIAVPGTCCRESEGTRATVRGSESAEAADDTATPPKARTLTPDSETDPTEARIQRAQEKQPRKPDEPCRFNCGRSTIDCHYYGPPCEERLRIHRSFFGERTPVLDEAEREGRYADDRREYRED